MEKIKIIIISSILISLTLGSCQDVLDEEVVSGVTGEYLNTPEGFYAGVNAAYDKLQDHYGQAHGRGIDLTVFGTDEYTNAGHGAYHYMNQYLTDLNAEAPAFWAVWSDFYQGINACNAVLNRGDNVELPQEVVNAKFGEVRFLRAHYYFILVQLFGDIHLTLEETVGVELEAFRTPESEVYQAIIDDLEFAVGHLPPSQNEFGRATQPAAKHMLSLVLLTRGYKDFAENDDFDRAANLAIDVIDNYDYFLLDEIDAFFDLADEKNAEILWSIQFTMDERLNRRGNDNHRQFTPWYEVYNDGLDRAFSKGYGSPSPQFRPTQWMLVDNFEPRDIDSRYDKYMQDVWYYNTTRNIPEGASVGDTAIWIKHIELSEADVNAIKSRLPGVNLMTTHPNNIGDPWSWHEPINLNIYPRPIKFDDWNRTAHVSRGGRNRIIYRLVETYLLAAEAIYMRDGHGDLAVEYINILRRRAAWPGRESDMEITAADVDIDFILDERTRELFGEDSRWFDLKRTGKLLERVRKYNLDAAPNIQEYHLLRPIPANQINRTANDFGQNPGY